MRVSREQAAKTRARIIKVAGRMFRQKGFDNVSVADIMEKAGLTHGGFYGHFDSKADLAIQASASALVESVAKFAPKKYSDSADPRAKMIDAYLSAEHRSNLAGGCLLSALGSDAGRASMSLRRAFAQGLQAYVDGVMDLIPGRTTAEKRQKAVATMSGLVGAMILARAVDDPVFSDEILRATSSALGSL